MEFCHSAAEWYGVNVLLTVPRSLHPELIQVRYRPEICLRRAAMTVWAVNGALYACLTGWLVCTYFCTVPGYDHIPAVRDSLCRPHLVAVETQMVAAE